MTINICKLYYSIPFGNMASAFIYHPSNLGNILQSFPNSFIYRWTTRFVQPLICMRVTTISNNYVNKLHNQFIMGLFGFKEVGGSDEVSFPTSAIHPNTGIGK